MAEQHCIGAFRTHTGEVITDIARIQTALNKVADDWAELACAIRIEDRYADHVDEETKDATMFDMIRRSEEVREGRLGSFTIWQRVNTELTGECVPLLGGRP